MGQRDAIVLALGVNFFKMYTGGEAEVRRILEGMNQTDSYHWCQLCGSGIPKVEVNYCYLIWHGKVQYRCDVESYAKNASHEFNDGAVIRIMENKNWVYLVGPVIPAPYDIPMRGFQGFRYSELLF